jgi:uncharacterized protein (DUF1778 family)
MTTALQILGDVMHSRARRETSVQVRLTWEEAESFRRAADIRGMSVSNWLRDIARKQARADLSEIGEKPMFNGEPRR